MAGNARKKYKLRAVEGVLVDGESIAIENWPQGKNRCLDDDLLL